MSRLVETDNGHLLKVGKRTVCYFPKSDAEYANLFDPTIVRCRGAIAGLKAARKEPIFEVST